MSKRVNIYEQMNDPENNKHLCSDSIKISSISTGFIDIPHKTSLNIFVQGCKLQCSGCQNPELWDFDGGTEVFLDDFKKILKKHTLPTWICWLGGDATYQFKAFMRFNEYIKSQNYGICLYTGRYFDEIKDLLDNVDIVVDGPWEGTVISDWKNTNQSIWIKENNKWFKITWLMLKEKMEVRN